MKTPREILLKRHEHTDAKLDSVRDSVVADLSRRVIEGTTPLPVRALLKMWDEIIWPARRTWAGLAVVWVIILVANANLASGTSVAATKSDLPAGEIWRRYQEQNQLLVELNGKSPSATDESHTSPGPRSDAADRWRVV